MQNKGHAWLFRLFVLGCWSLFTLMVIGISAAATVMHGRVPNFRVLFTWNLGWILWAGETFVVIFLARKLPIERKRLPQTISAHILLGLFVAFAHLGVEFAMSRSIEARYLPPASPSTSFVGTFAYKFHVYFVIYWMIVGATRAHDYYVRYRQSQLLASQLEAELAQAQLQALKRQLRPHFLFNTHHSIIALMLKNENAAAINMLTRLSELLRMTLERNADQHTSLKDELDALNLYLSIQKERYRERLKVQIDIGRHLLAAEVPCLILQPLAENAIKHGVDTLTTAGLLNIRAWREDNQLCLSVQDNGPGMQATFNAVGEKGIGLQNTVARLQRLYGSNHRFELFPSIPTGTEIRISFPFKIFQSASTSQEGNAGE